MIPFALFLLLNKAEATPTRMTDRAAMRMQDDGIEKLKRILLTEPEPKRRPELLSRLADLQLERAGISFRISEGRSQTPESDIYRASLEAAVSTLNALLVLNPPPALSASALFRRGKSLLELGRDELAERDLRKLILKFPDFEWRDSAEMALGDLFRKKEQHAEALVHYQKAAAIPSSPHLPFALHQAAWSFYSLGRIEEALKTLKKEASFYFSKLAQDSKIANSERASTEAFLEAALGDSAFFLFESLNRKIPGITVKNALETLTALDQDHQHLGLMAVKLARMLKAYTLSSELEELKSLLLKNHPSLPESSETAILLYQLHLERRAWSKIPEIALELPQLPFPDLRSRLEPSIRENLTSLHALIARNKSSTERHLLVAPLTSLTDSLETLLGVDHPTALSAQFALAETLFDLGDFEDASRRYLKLETSKPDPSWNQARVRLRRLSAEYHAFKKKHWIPAAFRILSLRSKTLEANPIHRDHQAALRRWTEEVLATQGIEPVFELEALKLEYQLNSRADRRMESVVRMRDFATRQYQTPEGAVAAGVVLDTLSDSEEWALLSDTARGFLTRSWKAPRFDLQLKHIAENAELKAISTLQDDAEILRRALNCMARATQPSVHLECALLRAAALQRSGKITDAETLISNLIETHPEEPRVLHLLLDRSDLKRREGRLSDSTSDLERYQHITGFKNPLLTRKLLEDHWFSGNARSLKALFNNPRVCGNEFRKSLCAPFRAALLLDEEANEGGSEKSSPQLRYPELYQRTLREPPESRALWCLLALRNPRSLAFQDRMVLLLRLSRSWKDLPSELQLRFLPLLATRTGETMESIRKTAPGIAPLRSNPESMERRVNLVREIESTINALLRLPSIEVQVRGIDELVRIHESLIEDLVRVQVPSSLLEPLRDKVASLQQAFKEASRLRFDMRDGDHLETLQEVLLQSEFVSVIPEGYRHLWLKAAREKRGNGLLQIASALNSTLLRGAALLTFGSPSEAAPWISAASDSKAKKMLESRIKRRGEK